MRTFTDVISVPSGSTPVAPSIHRLSSRDHCELLNVPLLSNVHERSPPVGFGAYTCVPDETVFPSLVI
jgi:hypothetical protein